MKEVIPICRRCLVVTDLEKVMHVYQRARDVTGIRRRLPNEAWIVAWQLRVRYGCEDVTGASVQH